MKGLLDGQEIRRRRENLGLTLQEVAEKAGVTRQYVSSVESNKIQLIPSGVARIIETVGLMVRFEQPGQGDFPVHFFTYGSMKPGFIRYGLVEGSLPEGHRSAVLAGYLLYDSGMDYPCLVRGARATDTVEGVVFEFTGKTIFKALELFDVIEGTQNDPPLFIRHRTVALVNGGSDQMTVPCWVYLYGQSVEGMKPVKGGNWLKEKGRRK
ncbi:helix-turn-helix domain-containing protein [Deinococcus psychrotolerans]|uniref:Helix-turn-helix domain-containing protein n=1 Tax=Deinococcus psychrotolerans TaxID=2489213 RepID=A0A3G8YH71_9DEIO|nr:gamma-glutamylcyclotransferase [Deinococcus psychrotolerans]AZI44333.1 helix-turn-helix domain-containing protein [Deinococcus psychrotolerans]